MNQNNTSSVPKLGAPGAGIPAIERFVAKRMIFWKARRTSREAALNLFLMERGLILQLLESTKPDLLATRVLIKRLAGLEDSSRYWSLLMTLDHLRIVNKQITEVIESLCAGRPVPLVASTAAVKPSEQVDATVIQAFEKACGDFENVVSTHDNLRTNLKFAHPWFGPMDAGEWQFMVAFHMALHRKQMELIIRGL
ncbi:MAG: DinB family protein [Gloeobacteraceae cyanobacterium ES-bin-144]|nr:DinB family protein [Verrucomicrobiales bacterium]